MSTVELPLRDDNRIDSDRILSTVKSFTAGNFSVRLPTGQIGVDAEIAGELNQLMNTVSHVAAELSRVAHEIGIEGKLGSQISMPSATGAWKDLVDDVNQMALSITTQVRAFAEANQAYAKGDLSRRITVSAHGEFADIKDTVNGKIDLLNDFATEMARVVREIGTDGRLGGQAIVPGVSGIWQKLTDNVNQLSSNITGQLRAIYDVASQVATGDFTHYVTVAAEGEVADLVANINNMIRKLGETTAKNVEQDWLKSNLVSITGAVQGKRDVKALGQMILSELVPLTNSQYGLFYMLYNEATFASRLRMLSSYAFDVSSEKSKEWELGEGLVGQCAMEKKMVLITDVPNGYIQISSGLGQAKPFNILMTPVMFEDELLAVIELASFSPFSEVQKLLLQQSAASLGVVLNTIERGAHTLELLANSQSLTEELQSQQEELRVTNQELEEKAHLLEEQKFEVEMRQREVEIAKLDAEEKSIQLALSSKYKSEFLSNMSHELRTPLNSLLILSEFLAGNAHDHLDDKEVEFAKLIQLSGKDLLLLINDLLDLGKIESGVVSLNISDVPVRGIDKLIEQTFQNVALEQGCDFQIDVAKDLPEMINTDEMRLLQVIKNLLSNSFKFTKNGRVTFAIDRAMSGWSPKNDSLNQAETVLAFSVVDSGIGISEANQEIVFEAFQQGDGSTGRKYGGTGLGLSISREIANQLGGELKLVQSAPQMGSTFTLFIPAGKTENPTVPVKVETLIEKNLPPKEAEGGLKGKSILIVDDDSRNVIALTAVLEQRGAVVISRESGQGAIAALVENSKIDLVLMDIMMPEMDGYQAMREIRKIDQFRSLPIIALTAKAMVGDREKCMEAGASDYMSKPVDIEKLSSTIRAMLSVE